MGVMEDRQEVALQKFEAAADASKVFQDGDENTMVPSASGDFPTMKGFLKEIRDNLSITIDGGTF